MSANDQPSFNLPFDFSNLLRNSTYEENSNDKNDAEESKITLTNAPNFVSEGSGDVTLESQSSWVKVEPSTAVSSWTHDREVRDRNKNCRHIYQEEGLNYGKDVSAAELKSRMSNAVKLREASVAKMYKILNESRDVQLCFLVDVIGTMGKYIEGVRDSIFKIVAELTEKHVSIAGHSTIAKKVSLAFVGYRDFGVKQFELLPFTKSAEDFREFCNKMETIWNVDFPEDVFGGLEKAICELIWWDSRSTKMIFHIADHPCHGKKYHSSDYTYSDRYPDGDPNGRTAENLFNSMREKGIQYHFGKITSHTDKMIELFSEVAGYDIDVFDIKNVDMIVDSVVSSVSTGMSIHPTMRAKKHNIKLKTVVPNWSVLPIFKGVFLSYEMPETIVEVISGLPMTQRCPTRAKVQVAEHPFAHGEERKVFYGCDLSGNPSTDIVLKEYIRNSTDTASRNSAFPYEIATQMQTIAAYLASVFNVCLEEKTRITRGIKFLKVQVLAIDIKPGEKRYMSCERRYGSDTKFLRFSNNADYEMLESTCNVNGLNFEVIEQLMAFSHWTYQVSDGYLMVVDLQGVLSTAETGRKTLELTDPAIHCKDLTRFGRTNYGVEGMKTFFGRHNCNKFCQALELEKHEATTS